MKILKYFIFTSVFTFFLSISQAQEGVRVFGSDSIKMAEAYINLSLTKTYFDSLSINRLSKILSFEKNELNSITNPKFIDSNAPLYNFANSLLYFNKAKFISRDTSNVKRDQLIEWKNTLEDAIIYFNSSKVSNAYMVQKESDLLYELIKFDKESCLTLQNDIEAMKVKFTPYFNNDIYPDFKRTFMDAKDSGRYNFDGLISYATLYNFPLKMNILNNENEFENFKIERNIWHSSLFISQDYELDLKLDLISRYLQLKYQATVDDSKLQSNLDLYNLYDSYHNFVGALENNQFFSDDHFFAQELNAEACKVLYNQLQEKYPYDFIKREETFSEVLSSLRPKKVKYFFPNPAPLPSAHMTISNYKPKIKKLGNVDIYLSKLFSLAGYNDRLHYYYDLDGYAMTTSLEKFNKDGSPIEAENRWYTNLAKDGKFSFYEIFKSIFFEVESEFRMFAVIVASKNVTISKEALSVGEAEELLKNSYPELPDDLKKIVLPNKNLTVLVYHFHQNDVGEVPMLDLNGKMTAEDHLKNAKLSAIIKQ